MITLLCLAAFTTHSSMAWIGRPFPGFFVLRNRVVPSIGLPYWPASRLRPMFQSTVLAIDGRPVTGSDEIYTAVRTRPVGTPFTYTLEQNGVRFEQTVASQQFTWWDAGLIFGAYLFNGLAFAGIGVGVWLLGERRRSTDALLALGTCISVYALTGMDLYGPHWFFRLYAAAEMFMPAVIVQLGLSFPVERTSSRRALLMIYAPPTALALLSQAVLDSPAAFSQMHLLATRLTACAMLFLVWAATEGYLRSPSEVVRNRVRVAVLGLLLAFVFPALILSLSAVDAGRAPANVMAFSGFLFPLSIGYAVYRRELFEIDTLVQRGTYYAILSAVISVAYLFCGAIANHFFVSGRTESQAFSLLFTLTVLTVLPYVRERLQRALSAVFGHRTYDAQEVLAAASSALGATLDLDEIARLTLDFSSHVLGLEHVAIFLGNESGFGEVAHSPARPSVSAPIELPHEHPLARLLTGHSRCVVRSGLATDLATDPAEPFFALDCLGAEVIVPMSCQGAVIGFLACGSKVAGTPYSARDLSFLQTFVNHAALSLQNARTFRDLHVLNTDLERRVDERTQQLASYVDQLQTAYATLQSRQEQLIAAQKMAAFGRLAAQIAHEMNTPLGAALNHLKSVHDSIEDCEALASDPATEPLDRERAFREFSTRITEIEAWTKKAVLYLRSVRTHGRADGPLGRFDVGRLIESDLQPLLMHRLRLAGGTMAVDVAPAVPEVYGDSGRLSQVLANLLNNAIDACEGLAPDRTRISVSVGRQNDDVVIRVADRGSGIPHDMQARIFDEFFTTKPPGKGTGLGLAIARDIVSGDFGGTLTCSESSPAGTTFTIRIPAPFSGTTAGAAPATLAEVAA